jgi:methionine-rich copper-binding protein CopC
MNKKSLAISVSALTLLGISSASAHTVLISSNPSKGAIVKSLPTKITLKFADPLLTLGKKVINRVTVIDPSNTVITSGDDLTRGALLTDSLKSVAPKVGVYKVSYRVSAQDGHIVTGAFTFTLQN